MRVGIQSIVESHNGLGVRVIVNQVSHPISVHVCEIHQRYGRAKKAVRLDEAIPLLTLADSLNEDFIYSLG